MLKSPPRWLLRASLLIFVLAGLSINKFNLSQTPSEIFPPSHPFQQGLDYIKSSRGWVADIQLVFEPQVSAEKKAALVDLISSNEIVVRTDEFSKAFEFIAQKITDPLERATVKFELEKSSFGERYFSDFNHERIFLYLNTTNTKAINGLRQQVSSLCKPTECWLTGEYVGYADFSTALIQTLFDSLFLSLMLVSLVIFYLTYAMNKAVFWAVTLSSFWGPAWMLYLIYLFDLSVNFITCIVASTLVGLTGDNAIQYLFAGKNINQGIVQRGVGSLQCAVIMALCCLSFLASYFEPPRVLGLLLSGGLILGVFGDLWVLKALVPGPNKI